MSLFLILLWIGFLVYVARTGEEVLQIHLLLMWIILFAIPVISVLYQLFRHLVLT